MNNIGSNDNKNSQMQNNYWIWLVSNIGIGLVISFLLPFPNRTVRSEQINEFAIYGSPEDVLREKES